MTDVVGPVYDFMLRGGRENGAEKLDRLRADAQEAIAKYDFDGSRACANCANAIVYGDPAVPMVRCTKGHGEPRENYRMFIGATGGKGFRAARTCPDRDMMEMTWHRKTSAEGVAT